MHIRVPVSLLKDLNTMSLVWDISVTEIVRRSLKAYARNPVVLSRHKRTTTVKLTWNIETDLKAWEIIAVVKLNVDNHRDKLNGYLKKPPYKPQQIEGLHYNVKE